VIHNSCTLIEQTGCQIIKTALFQKTTRVLTTAKNRAKKTDGDDNYLKLRGFITGEQTAYRRTAEREFWVICLLQENEEEIFKKNGYAEKHNHLFNTNHQITVIDKLIYNLCIYAFELLRSIFMHNRIAA